MARVLTARPSVAAAARAHASARALRLEHVIVAGAVVLAATALVPLWLATPLPLQDLPNHLLKVNLLQRWLADDPQVREVFALNARPLPNLTCYVALFGLSAFVDLVTAARLYLSLCVVGLSAAAYFLVRRVNPENLPVALVAPALAYTDFVSKGFLNFALALPLYVAALTIAARARLRPRDAGWLCALATLLYFTHGFVFLALSGAVVGLAVLTRQRLREASLRIACLLPGALLFASWLRGGIGGPEAGSSTMLPRPLSIAAWDALGWLFGMAFGSAAAAGWLVVLAALVAYTAAAFLRDVARRPSTALEPRDALLVLAALMAAVYFGTQDVAGPNMNVRLVPLAILTALGGLRAPRPAWCRVALAVLLAATTLGLHARNADAYARRSADVAEYLRGLDAIEPGASVLPIDLDPQVAGSRATLHAWAYYHLARGGWGPYVHAWPSQHPIAYRRRPWAPAEIPGGDWFPPETARRAAACYDYVLVWGERGAASSELPRSFVRVYEGGRLQVWENRAGVRRRPPAALPTCLEGGAG